MSESEDDGLFEEPARRPLNLDDKVTLLTIWGEEPCKVIDLRRTIDGHPMVTVTTSSGDTVTINRASIKE